MSHDEATPAAPPPMAPTPPPSIARRLLPLVCGTLIALLAIALWRAIPHDRPQPNESGDELAKGNDGAPAQQPSGDDVAKAVTEEAGEGESSSATRPGEKQAATGPDGATPNLATRSTDAKPAAATEGRSSPVPATNADVPVETPPPWQAALDLAEPPKFASIAFDVFDVQRRLPSRQELQRWFEPVAGHGLRMTEQNVAYGRFTVFEGTMRLRAPLREGIALHLMLDSYVRLVMHCYAGDRGVTLVSFQDDSDRWVAYATRRKPGAVLPEQWAWTASDEGRVRRSMVRNAGAIQLRHQDGELLLSHGDVVLVRAPLGLPPDEGPDAPLVVEDLVRPGAELTWSGNPAPTTKAEVVAGGWRLEAEKSPQRGWLVTPLPGEGLYETIVELADVKPGVGLFLSDGVQPPSQTLRFVTDTRSSGLALMPQGDNDTVQHAWTTPLESAVPLVSSTPWIRIVAGPTGARWWISVDGQHWAEPPMPALIPWTATTHLGVHHVAGMSPTGLTIRSLRRRPLAALHSLAPADVRAQARPVTTPDLAAWEMQTAASRPAAIDLPVWRRAVALRSLASGNLGPLGPLLLDLLLDEALQSDSPLPRQLRLLADAQLLLDARNQAPVAVALAHRYHRLGLAAFARGGDYPVSAVRPAFLSTALESRHAYPFSDPIAVRTELLARLYNDDWEGTVEFCRQTRFYNQHLQTPLFEWADALARRTTPALDKPSQPAVGRASRGPWQWVGRRGRFPGQSGKTKLPWQHPLAEELSKETYNALAELQGMLDGQAFDDAARTIATLDPAQMPGLAPAGDDGQLLLTLAAGVRRAAKLHPPLGIALERHFGQVAPLRVRQAIQSSDREAVQRVATLFPGTAAAAEAHRWLGDHALALGWFALAQAEYRRGLTAAPEDAQRHELTARLRLAAAMMGKDEGTPISTPVTIGNRALAIADFEALVGDMRQRAGQQTTEPISAWKNSTVAAPPVGPRATVVQAVLDGPLGENPNEEATPNLNRFQVDWVGRQLATLVVDGKLLVNNRFQLATYDLTSGQRLWQTAVPMGKKSGKSRDWGLIAMHPLVVGNRIYARQLFSDGPTLGCWDLATGQPFWLADTVKGLHVVSDPVMLQGRLAALCATRGDGADWTLRLVTFDSDRGEPLEQLDLAKLQSSWQARRMCAVRPLDDGLVVSLGGIVLRCDGWGQVLWIRRQVVLPADEEPLWVTQSFDPPLVEEGRLYVAQPGVRAIECIDAETGQLHWRRCVPEIRRAVGFSERKLIAVIEGGIVAVDPQTGDIAWRHFSAEVTAEVFIGGPGKLAYVAQRKTADGKKLQLGLVWLDPQTGQPAATHFFAALDDEMPRIGPFVHQKNRWWAFFGRGLNEAKRELLELTP